MRDHPGWRVWYVPNALDGSVTWCAQREPTIHAYSTEDLGKDMALADAELAAEREGDPRVPRGSSMTAAGRSGRSRLVPPGECPATGDARASGQLGGSMP
jgi:hypothetical protein